MPTPQANLWLPRDRLEILAGKYINVEPEVPTITKICNFYTSMMRDMTVFGSHSTKPPAEIEEMLVNGMCANPTLLRDISLLVIYHNARNPMGDNEGPVTMFVYAGNHLPQELDNNLTVAGRLLEKSGLAKEFGYIYHVHFDDVKPDVPTNPQIMYDTQLLHIRNKGALQRFLRF